MTLPMFLIHLCVCASPKWQHYVFTKLGKGGRIGLRLTFSLQLTTLLQECTSVLLQLATLLHYYTTLLHNNINNNNNEVFSR